MSNTNDTVPVKRWWLEHVHQWMQGDLPPGRIGDGVFLLRDQIGDILNTREVRGPPVAWVYELAGAKDAQGNYCGWHEYMDRAAPNVPPGSVRNVRPLYAGEAISCSSPGSHEPSAPASSTAR